MTDTPPILIDDELDVLSTLLPLDGQHIIELGLSLIHISEPTRPY